MSEKKKTLKDFPAGKPCARDLQEHAAFRAWFRMTLHPLYTMGIRYGRHLNKGTGTGYILRANNQAAIGFPTTQGILDLCYLHPQAHGSWFHIDIENSPVKTWREGAITDKDFAFHRKHRHRLAYRLLFWKENLPNLLHYLGCAADIRFVSKLTLALNYQIPNPAHETPEYHPGHPHLPGIQLPP
jgi:hypothetical protein